jgi:hypothetical protein
MPIYLCHPGEGTNEPWEHSIPVFPAPFDLDDDTTTSNSNTNHNTTTTISSSTEMNDNTTTEATTNHSLRIPPSTEDTERARRLLMELAATITSRHTTAASTGMEQDNTHNTADPSIIIREGGSDGMIHMSQSSDADLQRQQQQFLHHQQQQHRRLGQTVLRRVRHAEVVLVDDACIAYGRLWLRLRWPGQKGGFAGYIPMNRISNYSTSTMSIHHQDEGTNMICF